MQNQYFSTFHRSAIAQWILDPSAVYEFLLHEKIKSPLQIDAKVKNTPSFVQILRDKFKIIDANESAAKLYDSESVSGFKKNIVFNANDSEIINTCFLILGMSENPERKIFQTETNNTHGDKKTLWISCEIPALKDMSHGILISALDISAVKKVEKEIEEREQFLGAILRAVPDIVMVFDFKTRTAIFQNVDILEMLGYTAKDVADSQGRLLEYITHPDDKLTNDSILDVYAKLKIGGVYELTIRLQNNNGAWHHFYFRGAALDKDEENHIINAVIVARDITELLNSQKVLTDQQKLYQLLADNFNDVIITTNDLFGVNYISPSVAKLYGNPPESYYGKSDIFSLLGLAKLEEYLEGVLANAIIRIEIKDNDFNEVLEYEIVNNLGTVIPVEIRISILRNEYNYLDGLLIVIRDITERRKMDIDQRLAAKVFENSSEAVYITDVHGDIVQVNKAFIDITSYRYEDVIGKKPSQLNSGWHDINFTRDIKPTLENGGHWTGELMSRRANGEAFLAWMSISQVSDSRGSLVGLITSFRDITEAKSSEERIRRLAYFDPLTDLPNRLLFNDRLLQSLQRANRNRQYIAILFMDLDGFKAVNDSYGHALGDRLLTEVGKRLKDCIRSDDTVARMGGDEFTVILNALSHHETAVNTAAQIASKIIEKLNLPFNFDDKEVKIGVSIGISLYPEDANTEDELIKLADTAMYSAKQSGKNVYKFYTNNMHQRTEKIQEIEMDLRNAILGDEFVLAFQPKLNALTESLYGFEALLRWEHPEKGIVPPSGFMRLLDELGLGCKIGEWVIEKACEQLKIWQVQGKTSYSISVNIFARHYRDGDLAKFISTTLKKTGVSPNLLTIEITESLVMENVGFAYSVLSDLKALGVRISIDDFGTTMMSLQYLNRLPIDEIKIDRQFISNIVEEEQYRLVKAMIGIANSFGFDVVAEGVEKREQLDRLLSAECPKVQGFLFYRPLLKTALDFYMEKFNSEKD